MGDGAEGEVAGDELQGASGTNPPTNAAVGGNTGQGDMQQQMSSGIDKLDSLLTKTENAQYSMAHQTKQMKSFMQ